MSRPVYSVSVSKIESFRKYMFGQDENNESWNTLENLMATLQGKFKQLESAKYGEAFHAIIEGEAERVYGRKIDYVLRDKLHTTELDGYQYKEIFIGDKQAAHALEYRAKHPFMVKEVNIAKMYKLRHCDLIITGRIDGIEGVFQRDTKTKYGQVNILDDYIKSYQWRIYMDIVKGIEVFFYDIFMVTGYTDTKSAPFARVKPLEELYCTRYPGLSEDVENMLYEFLDFISHYQLQALITPSPARLARITEELI